MKKLNIFITVIFITIVTIITVSLMGSIITDRTKQYIDKHVSFSPVEVTLDDSGTEHIEKVDDFEVFKAFYDKNGEIVVASGSGLGGDNVIAPGTSNSVTFQVENKTNRVLYYTVNMDAEFSNEKVTLPVNVTLKRFDGVYIYGSSEETKMIGDFKDIKEEYALKPNRYSYYTFEWEWPFEQGNDELDTLLGNMSAEDPLTLKVSLDFEALFNAQMTPSGIKKDDVNLTTVLIVLLVSAPGIFVGCTSYYVIMKRKLSSMD